MNLNPEPVKAYRTSDGKIFTSEEKAEKHQDKLTLQFSVKTFADKHGIYTEGKEQLYNAIIENVEELKEILSII